MKPLVWAALLSAAVHAAVLWCDPGVHRQPPALSGSQAPIVVSLAYTGVEKEAAAVSRKSAPLPPTSEPKPKPPQPAAAIKRAAPSKKAPSPTPPASAPQPVVQAEPPAIAAAQPEVTRQAAAASTRPSAGPAAPAQAGNPAPSRNGIQTSSPTTAGNILIPAAPLYRQNPPPPYPRIAKARGYQGRTLLNVLVGRDGRVLDAAVAASSGYGLLDEAALKAVAEWIFEPAKRGDEAVEMWVKVPIRFQIR
ncbi:MAG: energy transducer TonB [Desulfobacterales bacterium]|nr:energy transducer TonB [Desulfobacterales bacterium]